MPNKKIEPEVIKVHVKNSWEEFKKEFKKHLLTFIVGGLSFVAALLWRDAISSLLTRYQQRIQNLIPWKEEWVVLFITAFAVTVVAVLGIIIVSKLLKTES
jgi:preprotein translocase subunit Sss1